ncbi:hypothetical protein BGW42_002361 [Actinomortierella wolfii]|nr:hypothetical protein BGW42_002361 [Actinomortierella wolfii]
MKLNLSIPLAVVAVLFTVQATPLQASKLPPASAASMLEAVSGVALRDAASGMSAFSTETLPNADLSAAA